MTSGIETGKNGNFRVDPGILIEPWGVRGTAPVAGRDRVRFGGHTICSRVIRPAGEEPVLIDAGSGLIPLGRRLIEERPEGAGRIHLLLTHFHLDHILGLPFFPPLYKPETELLVYSTVTPGEAESCLAGIMRGRRFPIELRELPASVRFLEFPVEGMEVGGIAVTCFPLTHPQGCVAFRVRTGNRSWVTATDTEHPAEGLDEGLAEFCRGADGLICDATFLPEEYPSKRGWGHSTWREGVRLAEAAGVPRLVLSHLNHEHDDRTVAEMENAARAVFPGASAAVEITARDDHKDEPL
jgi:phosphoribosyl 1,2-cyclic phosphodiesterase